MVQMHCKRCGANEDRINGFCSVECEEYYRLEEEINALDNVILERGAEIGRLNARIAELEAAQRWIPVSERLPDIEDGDNKDYDVVLTYPFRRDVIVATWGYDALDKTHRRRWFDCSSDEWGPDDITEYVTHWRERPIPPEVQE